MTIKSKWKIQVGVIAAFSSMLAFVPPAQSAGADQAKQILAATGVKGGVIVHLGCGDGELTAALHAGDSYLVQGLDADAARIDRARQRIHSLNLYGPVSVETWKGPLLPYNDNLVNLVVAENLGGVSMDEVMRVLAPNGVAYLQKGGQWTKTVKPRPTTMDEWTHYLHDADNNAVAHDKLVGPPRQMQWIAGPRYSRHHDHMSVISAMVSANGRNFYIFDEATKASILVPPKWFLVGRDAFNGTQLWKRPIAEWMSNLWPLKNGPQLLTRRLVAMGDRVYVTMGLNSALSALDAATGATIRTYEGTMVTEEILCQNGVLFLVVNPRKVPNYPTLQSAKTAAAEAWPDTGKRHIMAVQADTGATLWQKDDSILPETLTVEGGKVFYHDGEKVVCLNSASGARNWASAPVARRSVIQSYFAPTLVAYKDVLLFSGGTDTAMADYGGGKTPLFALSARDGRKLWQAEQPVCGHHTPKDILVANGLVWYGETAQTTDSGIMTGRDPETGSVMKTYPPDVNVPWFHHRCYRAKATDDFLMFSRTGIEYINTTSGHWTPNNWVRGGCLYGVMPANGMTYVTPHPCACYEEAKLYGFTALAPAPKTPPPAVAEEARFERGPAYDAAIAAPAISADDWPTYRHDGARSSSSKTAVAADLKSTWQTDLGGRLSSVVVAEGKLLVASLDTDTVLALDAVTGKTAWNFTAGGRVDSPPTIWQGRAIFGCADGYIYCLRAADGQLIWRFHAAPSSRKMVAYDQLESVWPVAGSALVQDGVVFSVAGRSMFLDGGLRLVRLDAKTGRKLSETMLDDRDPATKENLQSKATGMNMPVALSDILSCDGRNVYMRSLPFDLQGKRKFVEYVNVKEQTGDEAHLFSPTGFLDDTMWHRTYWVYGRAWSSGASGYYLAGRVAPAGRIMVFDDTTIWGYGRRWQFYKWSTPYVNHLFATAKQPQILTMAIPPPAKIGADGKKKGNTGATPTTRFAYEWSDDLPVQAVAMVHAGPKVFVAGPPSFMNEEEASKALDDPKIHQQVIDQGLAYDGRKGSILTTVSARDGKGEISYRLASMPVFDGMAAAGGRIYMSTTDGKVLCLGGSGGALTRAADVIVTPRSPTEDKPLANASVQPAAGGKKKKM